jgi:hypothetical protein
MLEPGHIVPLDTGSCAVAVYVRGRCGCVGWHTVSRLELDLGPPSLVSVIVADVASRDCWYHLLAKGRTTPDARPGGSPTGDPPPDPPGGGTL